MLEDRLMGPTFQNMLADAIDTKARELGYHQAGLGFSPAQQEYIRRQVISESIQKLTDKQRGDLLELIKKNEETQGKKYDAMLKPLAALRLEASNKYKEEAVKKGMEIAFQRARQRVRLDGRIGE